MGTEVTLYSQIFPKIVLSYLKIIPDGTQNLIKKTAGKTQLQKDLISLQSPQLRPSTMAAPQPSARPLLVYFRNISASTAAFPTHAHPRFSPLPNYENFSNRIQTEIALRQRVPLSSIFVFSELLSNPKFSKVWTFYFLVFVCIWVVFVLPQFWFLMNFC